MRTKEEQEAINKACKYHPETKKELQELVDDPKVYLGDIDTSQITDMSDLFAFSNRTDFSGIEKWNTSNVTDMGNMFEECTNFNQPLNNWDVSNVTSMRAMFANCVDFNQDISSWDVANVTDMSGMFAICTSFNQPLDNWDVSSVYEMSDMFFGCEEFNQPLNDWNVREDCDIYRMFTNTSQTYENVKDSFSEEQLLDSGSEKIIKALNNEKEYIEEKITNFLVKLNNQKEQADMDKSNSKQNGEHEIMNVNVDEITTALISQDFSLDNLEPAKQYVGQVDTNDLTRAVGRALIYQQNQDWLENGVEDELKDLVNDLSVSDAVLFAQQLDDYFEVYRTEDLQGDFSDLSTYDILLKFGDIDLNEPFYEFNGYGNAISLSEDDVKERVRDFLLEQVDSQSLEDILGALDYSCLSDLKAQYEGIADANRDALEYEDYELLDNQIDDGDFLESTEVEEVVEKLKQAQKQVAEKSNSRGR